jgi:hypothetical protein
MQRQSCNLADSCARPGRSAFDVRQSRVYGQLEESVPMNRWIFPLALTSVAVRKHEDKIGGILDLA